ncbi:MAG: acetolactate synthase small subunit [Cytophagales bacterium CG12_big_fil_rev_8_21_14_0_65_40_12]|nr:MAG: acetolactate synthase small subunit [Cytophagales bacterium CG12_big_fil_rev_8_21_14_0_65_40_12]PIW04042.1 MAG: acetolactate synthase small subunit [Cytophagales bacterium CG17_big_fil_post_rev_8_21_14_2_50_40_13]
MERAYTISIFSENSVGLLNRITSIFTRRHVNIDSINSSESENPGIYRFTIVVHTTEEQIKKMVLQIEKQVEVLKAVYHIDEETVFQEIALYKISTQSVAEGNLVETLIRDNNARILSMEQDFMIIEKTGHKEETQDLLEFLRPYGVLEFVRSGRVSVIKPMDELEELK